MSYSQNYSTSVAYSGSESYSYPASQSGGSGTVRYSGSVPVDITINVNTAPFDSSVSRFNGSIIALGGSVAAMNAAQCAAIRKSAEEISASLINGFFGAINTELTQQIQALDSAVKAVFGLIQQQGKAVSEKKEVMEGDYSRITSRYVKLFADLDSECYKRIYALDRQSFTLSEKVQKELLTDSASNAAAISVLGLEEASSSKTLVLVSALNRKVLDVLKTIRDYIAQESVMASLVDSFLSDEETEEKIPFFIPVIWAESAAVEAAGTNSGCFIPEQIGPDGKQQIAEKTNKFCSSCSDWKPVEAAERDAIGREFSTLAEKDFAGSDGETDERIYKTMLALWQNSDLSCLEGANQK